MAEPRTTREALIVEILGELDELLTRTEALPESIAQADTRLRQTVGILEDAGDRYRSAVTAFTEEAKLSLTTYVQHQAAQAVSFPTDEQRACIQEAVVAALACATVSSTNGLNCCDRKRGTERASARVERLLEHVVTAAIASVVTATVLILVLHLWWR